MKKFLTISLVLAFVISGAVACKKVSRGTSTPYTPQQEETEMIDEVIATEEETVDADTGTVTDTEVVIIDEEAPADSE